MRFLTIFIFSIALFAAKYEIVFHGNRVFDDKTLYEELGFKKTFWQIVTFKKLKPKVDEKILPSLKEELELFYKQEGFWKAKIEVSKNKATKKAIFNITENSPIIVKKIEITSNFPIEKYIYLKENERFSTKNFVKTKEKIKKMLLKNGYCSFDFDPKAYIYLKRDEAYVVFYVDKNRICKIKDIEIFNNETISKDVILSHIYFKKNENFSLEKIDESYKRLYSLEYFDSVRIDYSKKINNNIFSQIFVKERKKRNIYRAGMGYESNNGFYINFSWKNINIKQKQVKLETFYSKNYKEIATKVFVPTVKIASNSYDVVNELSYKDQIFDYFSQRIKKIGIDFIKEYYKISYSIGLFYEKIDIYNASNCFIDRSYNILYPKFSFVLDNRDSKIEPKKGFFIKSDIEGSIDMLSKIDYIKNVNSGGIYFSFDELTLFLKAKIGFIDSDEELSYGKLFFAGGANSNRAYGYNKLYAIDSDCKSGGYSIFENSVEISYPVYKDIKGAVFWDRTVLSVKKFSFFEKAVNAFGFGIRYPTPVGDIKMDFGFDIKNFKQNALHLSIGATF